MNHPVYVLLEATVLCLLFVTLLISENKNKKVTRSHGLGLTGPNALLTKNGSGIILINSHRLKYTKS
jgi:hypothetical protein